MTLRCRPKGSSIGRGMVKRCEDWERCSRGSGSGSALPPLHDEIFPNSFQIPGDPDSTHTHPICPSANGAECHTLSPTCHVPSRGGALSWIVFALGTNEESTRLAITLPRMSLFS